MVKVVESIETATLSLASSGARGMLVAELNAFLSTLRLNTLGREIFTTLLAQSDVVRMSECKRYIEPREFQKVIDVEVN
jgi:hypothetical protein